MQWVLAWESPHCGNLGRSGYSATSASIFGAESQPGSSIRTGSWPQPTLEFGCSRRPAENCLAT
eukprot:118007-Heterocapsa_arctica.AAC.1